MARLRVDMNAEAIRDVMSGGAARALIDGRAAAVADACNNQSSWGGYAWADASTGVRANAKVWSYGRNDSITRKNRLIANIGAE